jgi:methionyl-tRNA formyltransferase
MRMDTGLDTGPILSQRSVPISPDDTCKSLTAQLAQLGADLLIDTLPEWLAGKIEAQLQDESDVTYAPQLKKEQGRINWQDPATDIGRQVRAFYSWPGAFTHWNAKPLKILRAAARKERMEDQARGLSPGTVVAQSDRPAVVTGDGVLELHAVQLAGKRPMSANDFARGARDFIGACLA